MRLLQFLYALVFLFDVSIINAEVISNNTPYDDLYAAGWSESSALAVSRFHADYWQLLAKESSTELKRQLHQLSGLSNQPSVLLFLTRHPNAAGLLAQTRNPSELANTLNSAPNPACYQQWLTLYHFILMKVIGSN